MKVEVSNITFGYSKAVPVIKDVSFEVNNGEVLGILGGSGSGKSTLLRIICGLLRKQESNLFKGSVKVDDLSDTRILRKNGKMGLMFQQQSLLPNLTLEKNIQLPTLMNKNLRADKDFLNELIEMVGLYKYKGYLPKELSGGMQTRGELARTFITKPKLLLLDEPFSSLDYGWKIDLYSKLVNLIKQFNSTAVIVSHDINELILLSNKIILLSKSGRLMGGSIKLSSKPENYSEDSISEYLSVNNKFAISIQSELLKDKSRVFK